MKTIAITSNSLTEVFIQLQAQLGGNLLEKEKEFTLTINNFVATGTISGVAIEGAISYIDYDIIANVPLEFFYKIDNALPIHFMYGYKGAISFGFESDSVEGVVEQFQTGIFANTKDRSIFFSCKKTHHIKMCLITTDVSMVKDHMLKKGLQQGYFKKNFKGTLTYVSSLNAKIAELINELNQINEEGLVRNLIIHSIVYRILALEIEQHKLDKASQKDTVALSKKDLEIIAEIANLIRNHPEKEYNLYYLCDKTGLTSSTLQQGFKIIHNKSFVDFIKNSRLEAAENLLRNTDLTISEVGQSVGISSRSYFTRIFKEKYNCNPKEYKTNQKANMLIA